MAIYSHPDKSIALDELIPLVKEDLLAKDLFALKCILIDMVSRLKKMENEKEFHLYPIEEFFTRGISKRLKQSRVNNIKDLVDFDNIYNLTLLFSKKERGQFTIEFSRLFCFLSFRRNQKEEILKIRKESFFF